jgi:adenylyltransferase/sulfurtransferase
MLSDAELLRYSRQVLLPGFDIGGQEKLKAARVLVVGLGGIGCPVALYLAAAGVGELRLADFDRVEETNLQRQVLFGAADVGRPKATVAAEKLRLQNPHVTVREVAVLLDADNARELVADVDLVVDGCDNFLTRDAVNAACVSTGTPLVSAAAIGYSAQLAVYDPRQAASPCYRCLYPDADEAAAACSDSGVLAPVVGVVGTLAATEALKLLSGVGAPLVGRLWLWESLAATMRTLAVPRDPACPVCRHRPAA